MSNINIGDTVIFRNIKPSEICHAIKFEVLYINKSLCTLKHIKSGRIMPTAYILSTLRVLSKTEKILYDQE